MADGTHYAKNDAPGSRKPVITLGQVLQMPLWLIQLAGSTKSFERNRLIRSRTLNERGLHTGRVRLAHALSGWRRRRLAGKVQIPEEDRRFFDENGYVVRPDFLPQAEFEALLGEVRTLGGPVREMVQGSAITRRAGLDPAMLKASPVLRAFLRNRVFRDYLYYAGTFASDPIICLQAILSHAVTGPDDPQCILHSDTFHPTAKAWLFLKDVGADEGPFTYVPGSHRLTPRRLAWERRMSLEAGSSGDVMTRQGSFRASREDLAELRLPEPLKIAVKANTLVVADTYGFHARGQSARATVRAEIWAYSRRNPFLPWLGGDFWNIKPLGWLRMALFWRVGDLLEKAAGKRNPWQRREGAGFLDEAGSEVP